MLTASIEFKECKDSVNMWCERDSAPFDDYIIGGFKKEEDGYFVFYPALGVQMTCKQLRLAAQKASDLNMNL